MSTTSTKTPSKSPRKRAHFSTDDEPFHSLIQPSRTSLAISPRASPFLPDLEEEDDRRVGRRVSGNRRESDPSSKDGQKPRTSARAEPNSGQKPATDLPHVPYNAPTDVPSAGQPVYVHHTGTQPLHNAGTVYLGQPCTAPSGYCCPSHPLGQPVYSYPVPFQPNLSMANYENAAPPNLGINFQPPVPDTTNGPYIHHYHPRHDGVPLQPCPPPMGVAMPIPGPTVIAAPMTAPFGPVLVQPHMAPSVMMAAPTQVAGSGPHIVGQPVMVNGAPQVVAGNFPCPVPQHAPAQAHLDPVLGVGRTATELTAEQRQFAEANGLFQPQDFKPGDDDPTRYYMVREVDGTWTQRDRMTIDSLGCRWYLAPEGYFYAVRLSD
ncbi:hypothetical protein VTK73DRAFT_909 [Phialemonium thermophilum]|uniref:Uncharacterized protein n=1 Tax=Phialemonium thermophilum TaxID=223376 RepID=A0ABR3Y4Y5_9PEZI